MHVQGRSWWLLQTCGCFAFTLLDFTNAQYSNVLTHLNNDLSDAGRATFLCKTLQSNNFKPTEFFETSCRKQEFRVRGLMKQSTAEDAIILNIFEKVNSERNTSFLSKCHFISFYQNIWPKAIIKSITRARATEKGSLPAPLKWGIDNEDVAITRYSESKPLD